MSERFELVREAKVEEINSLVKIYRHKKTGARIMSVENDDENKVFGITFRTPPKDSTGIPHIMEHSVLCGSKKFPLKEPFIELVKGSLNTYLNAMTYPDKTTYPVASQNEQDLYNLADVYLDAVFNPLIPPETLHQEGWHYELDKIDDPLTIKGIVFNEMKGVYSSPDSLLYRYVRQTLFPENTYGVDSGGDPDDIPNLTYEQFKSFHETYYHPSNSWIFFYGDDNPERRLKLLEEYLEPFEVQEVDSTIALQSKLTKPQAHTFYYDCEEEGDDAKKTMLTLTWLLPEATPELEMGLSLLSYMLVSTPASPLRKTLIDSGLGEELTGGGLSSYLRQMTFSVGLKGIAAKDADKVEKLIFETMKKIADEGFTQELLEAALNTVEFSLRENNTGSYPRGLALMLDTLSCWLHDRDPIEAMSYESHLKYVKTQLEQNSRWLLDLLQEHLLNNSHRVRITLEPKKGLRQTAEQAERLRLDTIQAALTESEKQAIVENTASLKLAQETPDPPELLAQLPMLKLEDMEPKNKELPIDVSPLEGSEILYHDIFTNGILYLDVGFDLHSLPQEWIPYMPLFGRALVEIGTQTEDDVTLAQRIRRKTGGVSASTFNMSKSGDPQGIAKFILRGKSTTGQTQDMLAIFKDLLLTVNFDNKDRFRQMVLRSKANREAGLIPGGHGIVNTRLRSHFDTSSWLSEQTGGLEQLFFLRRLAEQVENDWPSVLHCLEGIRDCLVNRNHMFCNVTLDRENWKQSSPQLQDWIQTLPAKEVVHQTWTPQPLPSHEGLTLSAQVNYVGKGTNLFDHGYQYHASVAVITNHLRTTWLWDKVRMQGGAYGGMCGFNKRSGVFAFLSYRDPNLVNTLDAYDKAGDFLRRLDIDHEELSRSIIGTIGDIDSYQLPDAKGRTSMVRHLLGETAEQRQKVRDEILNTNIQDFHNFADALDNVRDHGHVVVLGSEEALTEANQTLSPQLPLTKVQ